MNSLNKIAAKLWKHQWAVVGGLAAIAFVLGVAGLHELKAGNGSLDDWSWEDAIYFSLRLFGLNYDLGGDGPDHPYASSNWQLLIARFLAPASTFLAVVKAVAVSAASRIAVWWISFWKGHAVVCGAGERGTHLALSLRREGNRVVVIEQDKDSDALVQLRSEGVFVIPGSITDPTVLDAARVSTAGIVVALTPSLEANLEAVLAASRRKGDLPVQAFAYAPRAFATMFEGRRPFARDRPAGSAESSRHDEKATEYGFFDHNASAARVLVGKHAPDLAPAIFRERRGARILIAGDGEVVPELLGTAIVQCQFAGPQLPCVTLLTVDEDAVARGFPLHHPQRHLVADIRVVQMPVSRMLGLDLESPQAGFGGEPFDLVVVACRQDGDTLALATAFAQQKSLAPRVVAGLTPSTKLESKFDCTFGTPQPLEGIEILNLLSLGCEARHVVGHELDEAARAIHKSYFEQQLGAGAEIGQTMSLHLWEDLRGDFRQTNRSQADHIAIKKRILALSRSEETIELLAEAEHRRWMADRIVSGWRYAATRDDRKRLHPSIRPYAELSESDRNKDRVAVRQAGGTA